MNFILTRYLDPMTEPIQVSGQMSLELCTASTGEEAWPIYKALQRSWSEETGFGAHVPLNEELAPEGCPVDFHVRSFLDRQDWRGLPVPDGRDVQPELWRVACNWILLRFDDEGMIGDMKKTWEETPAEERAGMFFMPDDGDPLVDNSKAAVHWAQIVSVMVQTDGINYSGQSFLLHDSYDSLDRMGGDFTLARTVVYRMLGEYSDHEDWSDFRFAKMWICEAADALEPRLESEERRTLLLYLGQLLKMAGDADEYLQLATLAGCLELMLTHSPDFNRFNVEDSISKQFALKVTLVMRLEDPSLDLGATRSRLRTVYSQRSNVVHGNFKKLRKYEATLSKKDGKEEYFGDLNGFCYRAVNCILKQYSKDPELIEFLKAN